MRLTRVGTLLGDIGIFNRAKGIVYGLEGLGVWKELVR